MNEYEVTSSTEQDDELNYEMERKMEALHAELFQQEQANDYSESAEDADLHNSEHDEDDETDEDVGDEWKCASEDDIESVEDLVEAVVDMFTHAAEKITDCLDEIAGSLY